MFPRSYQGVCAQGAGEVAEVVGRLYAPELCAGMFEAGRDSQTFGFVSVGGFLKEALQVTDVGFEKLFVDGLLCLETLVVPIAGEQVIASEELANFGMLDSAAL